MKKNASNGEWDVEFGTGQLHLTAEEEASHPMNWQHSHCVCVRVHVQMCVHVCVHLCDSVRSFG